MVTDSLQKKLVANKDNYFFSKHVNVNSEETDVNKALNIFNFYAKGENVNLLIDIDTSNLNKQLDSLFEICLKPQQNSKKADTVRKSPSSYLPGLKRPQRLQQQFIKPGLINVSGPIDTDSTSNPSKSKPFKESVLSSAQNKESLFLQYQMFLDLYLSEDTLYLDISNINPLLHNSEDEGSRHQGTGNQGRGNQVDESYIKQLPYLYALKFPAKDTTIICLSTLESLGWDKGEIEDLYGDKKKQKQLSNLYGYVPIKDIDNIISKSLEKNNDSVSILGFDISRRWFPMAMLLSLVIIYTLLFQIINFSKISKQSVISNFPPDDVITFLISNKWLRFFIWVFSPVVLLFFSFYTTLIQYDIFLIMLKIIFSLYCFVLGCISFKNSLTLWQNKSSLQK